MGYIGDGSVTRPKLINAANDRGPRRNPEAFCAQGEPEKEYPGEGGGEDVLEGLRGGHSKKNVSKHAEVSRAIATHTRYGVRKGIFR